MRRKLSLGMLLAGVVASVATSELPETFATAQLPGPTSSLSAQATETVQVDVLATQSPSGPFGGAVQVVGEVDAPSATTVTATLYRLDGSGAVQLDQDVVAVSGTGEWFLFDDLDAFDDCASGSTCDQTFEVVVHTTSDATVSWTFHADLDDVDEAGRTGTVELSL